MTCVYARPGESFESLMRRFKKGVEDSGIMNELRRREAYEKPSDRNRREKEASRKRAIKRQKKMEEKSTRTIANFKWNKDRTKKIPLDPPRRDNSSRPGNNKNLKQPNTFNNKINLKNINRK